MTAVRVVTDHEELENSGQVTHDQLDSYVNTTPWLVVSGAAGAIPPGARRLKAGSGIILTDTGPGGDLIITATSVSGTTGAQISWMETPTGVADGVNKDFTLANVPIPLSALMFFVNGVLQKQGNDSDYRIVSGNIVHIIHGYRSGSNLTATYPY